MSQTCASYAYVPYHACLQYTVELTLEEIYFGCLKKVSHKRKVLTEAGELIEEPRTLTIDVKPGLPTGTRFVFEG
jgi:DnaJ family protein B protein 13